MRTIYFDNNATTAVAPEVLDAMLPYLRGLYGNPSSVLYKLGVQAFEAVEEARANVARFLHCDPEEVLFTSGGSEGNTQAVLDSGPGGRLHARIITSSIEHPSVRYACRWARDHGSELVELPVTPEGVVEPGSLAEALERPASLVSVMWANNETGVVQPVERLAELAKEHGALFHTDAVQAAGKLEIDLRRLPADLLTITGHKIRGPKGVGALFVRKPPGSSNTRPLLAPRILGGPQERGLRAGTENVASIVGLGKACSLLVQNREEEILRLRRLRDRLEERLVERCARVEVHGRGADRLANTICLGWPDLNSKDLLRALDEQGICASSGSACTTSQPEPSHVLTSMGIAPDLARGSIRLSLGEETTDEEVDFVVRALERIVRQLREAEDD